MVLTRKVERFEKLRMALMVVGGDVHFLARAVRPILIGDVV